MRLSTKTAAPNSVSSSTSVRATARIVRDGRTGSAPSGVIAASWASAALPLPKPSKYLGGLTLCSVAEPKVSESKTFMSQDDGPLILLVFLKAVVGTVEELSTSPATQNLVRDQFETVYFSQVNFIKAALPQLRAQHTGHIMVLTSIGGHIGTPGMSFYTAAVWALEGFCDSLAYEIAPFNIKMTIVQPNKEILSLTNRLIFSPPLPQYEADLNPAPNMRDVLSTVLNSNPDTYIEQSEDEIQYRYAKLPPATLDKLVMETVHALTAIGGHENPPARHIVGFEGAIAVREKLKTVTEELEDFVEVSLAVDIFDSELKAEARKGRSEMEATQGMGAGEGSSGAGMGGFPGMGPMS